MHYFSRRQIIYSIFSPWICIKYVPQKKKLPICSSGMKYMCGFYFWPSVITAIKCSKRYALIIIASRAYWHWTQNGWRIISIVTATPFNNQTLYHALQCNTKWLKRSVKKQLRHFVIYNCKHLIKHGRMIVANYSGFAFLLGAKKCPWK